MNFRPNVIIFDVDGVLVDVRGSFHRTTLETVQFFTGRRVTRAELHRWKNRSGFNDDWKLSTAWVHSLGGSAEYEEVKRKFVELYWGHNGDGRGNVAREKWLLPRPILRRLAGSAQLALFTGRVRKELDYTLDRGRVREFFAHIVTAEDVVHPKPHPEGLLKVLDGRDPATAIYIGDNVDDALAAQSARIPFVGILPHNREARRERGPLLSGLGAIAIFGDVRKLEPWLKRLVPARSGGAALPARRPKGSDGTHDRPRHEQASARVRSGEYRP
jgi:HAD superfamily hydrolase (TIGR01548 family)